MSDNESNCSPNGLDTFRSLAAAPSIKSKIVPTNINNDETYNSPVNAFAIAKHPQSKFKVVIAFGMCFFINKLISCKSIKLRFKFKEIMFKMHKA